MNLLQTIAIGTAVKDAALKAAKSGLKVGTYDVDMTVRVKGSVTKGEDYMGVIAQRAEPWKLLAVALNRLNGVTVESIVREAETLKDEEADRLKEATAAALNAIKGETKAVQNGKTITALVCEVIAANS